MSQAVDYDIIIVGGGMVGTALACALAQSRFRIALIEAGSLPGPLQLNAETPFEPRVSALTQASRNLLDNLEVWQSVTAHRVSPYYHMQVWDGEGTGRIQFSAGDIGQPVLGHIVENKVMVGCLFERAAELVNVAIKAGTQVTDVQTGADGNTVLALSDGSQLNARLVIGADGAQSNIRQLAGFETREWDYDQQAIVTTVRTEQPNQATAWQRFLSTGPLAFLPLQQSAANDADDDRRQHYSSIVWSLDSEQVADIMALNDTEFNAALARAFENKLGAVEWSDQRFAFPLRQRHVKQYVQAGIALVGDAAHTIHPLAGQGVNLGFMDVAVLAEELLRAEARELGPGDPSVLQRYQRRRQSDNLLMAGAMEGFKRLFGETAPAVRWLRSSGMSLVDQFTPLKNTLISRAMGLDGDLPALTKTGQ